MNIDYDGKNHLKDFQIISKIFIFQVFEETSVFLVQQNSIGGVSLASGKMFDLQPRACMFNHRCCQAKERPMFFDVVKVEKVYQ